MELNQEPNGPRAETLIEELLQQNTQLRLDLALLRAALNERQSNLEAEISDQMVRSQSLDELSPEVIEMLSKFDFK